MLGRRQYPKEHMAEAKRFKDTEKTPHIEGVVKFNLLSSTYQSHIMRGRLLQMRLSIELPL
jgi:hypothetical protein